MSVLSRFLGPLSDWIALLRHRKAARDDLRALEDDAIAHPGGLSERRLMRLFIDERLPLSPVEIAYKSSQDLLARSTPSGRCVFRVLSPRPGLHDIEVSLNGRPLSLPPALRRELALAGAWLAYDIANAPLSPQLSAFLSQRKQRADRRFRAQPHGASVARMPAPRAKPQDASDASAP